MTLDKDEILLPCPFCGGKANLRPLETFSVPIKKGEKKRKFILCWFVECGPCSAKVSGLKPKNAIKRWNTRKGTHDKTKE